MINQASITATSSLHFGDHFMHPAYGGFCFAHLPALIQANFGLDTADLSVPQVLLESIPGNAPYERIILMLVDAFGWMFFEKYAEDFPCLKEIVQNGTASRLTSMFPSTTAAHVTCIYTGLPVGQSGVYEWFYYEPQLDQVISPLMFTPAGSRERDQLKALGAQPANLFPDQTLFQSLSRGGVNPYVFTANEYAYSTYNTYVTRGAEIVPYITWTEALTNLKLLLERKKNNKLYAFLYFSGLDAIGHAHGPAAPHTENELLTFLGILDRFLGELKHAAGGKRTLLCITADHGIALTDPKTTVYLNRLVPGIEQDFAKDRLGEPILFGGSPRDLFLYVQPARLDAVCQRLETALAGKAEVHRTSDLLQDGFFGCLPVSDALLTRLGNLVILPYNGESVYWYEKDRFEQRYRGHHGGLTPQEMLIPLLAYPLS